MGLVAGSSEAPADARPLRLELTGLSKRFGGSQALTGVDLAVRAGEVHGLLGENGSGKSTLIKILAGFHEPDGGELRIDGQPEAMPLTAARLQELGISFVHQDLGMIDSVTVTENLALRDIATRRGLFISWRRANREATALLARHGLAVRGERLVSTLSPFERAMVAIVRALEGIRSARAEGRGLLVLDEAMAFLADHEREQLASLVRTLAGEGVSVLLVSHDLDDALGVCGRMTVLRDGKVAGSLDSAGTNRGILAELILGHAVERGEASDVFERSDGSGVRVTELSGVGVAPLSLELGAGEIVGLTGLVGECFSRVPYLLYGAERGAAGTLELAGRTFAVDSLTPARALDAGIALVPGDRQRQGAIGALSVGENVELPRLSEHFVRGRLRGRALRKQSTGLLRRFDVRPPDARAEMLALSGGNQQKAIVAKWLQLDPKLLLLDEPTLGVDVGSREQIFGQLRALAAAGATIVCASSDYAQLAELCERVFIFAGGKLRAELRGNDLTREEILRQCLLAGESVQAAQQIGDDRGE